MIRRQQPCGCVLIIDGFISRYDEDSGPILCGAEHKTIEHIVNELSSDRPTSDVAAMGLDGSPVEPLYTPGPERPAYTNEEERRIYERITGRGAAREGNRGAPLTPVVLSHDTYKCAHCGFINTLAEGRTFENTTQACGRCGLWANRAYPEVTQCVTEDEECLIALPRSVIKTLATLVTCERMEINAQIKKLNNARTLTPGRFSNAIQELEAEARKLRALAAKLSASV